MAGGGQGGGAPAVRGYRPGKKKKNPPPRPPRPPPPPPPPSPPGGGKEPVEPGLERGILPNPHGRAAWRRTATRGGKNPGRSVREGNAMRTTVAARRCGRRAIFIEQNRGDDAAS